MWGVALWEKVFVKNERMDLSELCKIDKTWYLRENEMASLRRTEKAMTKAMSKVKLIEKRKSQDL